METAANLIENSTSETALGLIFSLFLLFALVMIIRGVTEIYREWRDNLDEKYK